MAPPWLTCSLCRPPDYRTTAVGLALFNGMNSNDEPGEPTSDWRHYQMQKDLYKQTDYLACERARQ